MKFLLVLSLVSVAAAYNSFIQLDGRNVIGEGKGAMPASQLSALRAQSASFKSAGKGLSGSLQAAPSAKKVNWAPAPTTPTWKAAAPKPKFASQVKLEQTRDNSWEAPAPVAPKWTPAPATPTFKVAAPKPVVQVQLPQPRLEQTQDNSWQAPAPVAPAAPKWTPAPAPATPTFKVAAAKPVVQVQAPQPRLEQTRLTDWAATAPIQQERLTDSSVGSLSNLGEAYDVVPAGGVIVVAVQTRHRFQYVDVESNGETAAPQQIVIPASAQPLEIAFQSQSSPVNVKQVHLPGQPGQTQESSHEEQPDILKQTIIKPVIQEIIEAIQPIRKITQEVRPVQEHINQILTRGQKPEGSAVLAPVQATVPQPTVQQAEETVDEVVPTTATQIAAPGLTQPIQVTMVGQPSASLAALVNQQIAQQIEQQQELIERKKKAKAAKAKAAA